MGFSDRTPPGDLVPLNLYGRSKNAFDKWVLEQVELGAPAPPHWAGFKFFNVYGAREGHKGRMASIIWKAERDMAAHDHVQLFQSNHPDFADGEQRRDFVWVGDVLDEMRWVAKERPASDLYNAGTGVASTFRAMIEAYFAALGESPRIEYVPMPAALSRQYQNFTQADMSKLRAAGYTRDPVLPPEGVARTLREMTELGWRD
jgi:ADP-L-glycero-D-manno-heptose 6-epimerase